MLDRIRTYTVEYDPAYSGPPGWSSYLTRVRSLSRLWQWYISTRRLTNKRRSVHVSSPELDRLSGVRFCIFCYHVVRGDYTRIRIRFDYDSKREQDCVEWILECWNIFADVGLWYPYDLKSLDLSMT